MALRKAIGDAGFRVSTHPSREFWATSLDKVHKGVLQTVCIQVDKRGAKSLYLAPYNTLLEMQCGKHAHERMHACDTP
eukprot:364586-Chlamydomonas_euryale.AAC.25